MYPHDPSRVSDDLSSDLPTLHPMHRKRWYDQVANMTMALHLAKDLPPSIQKIIASSLNSHIENHRRSTKSDRSSLSMGANRTLGLYKAASRYRWYDKIEADPDLRRAFLMMGVIPETVLSDFAHRIVDVVRYVRQQEREHERPLSAYFTHELTSKVDQLLNAATVNLSHNEHGIRLSHQAPDQKMADENKPPSNTSHHVVFLPNKRGK